MFTNERNLRVAHAHCDVPCGIYDPATAQIAAHSVARFLGQIAELEGSGDTSLKARAQLSRLVEQKEQHAAEVKSAVVVIWGDYIKAPQIEQFPEIHSLVHSIMLKASACKQDVEVSNGTELVDLVNQMASIFWATKSIETETVTAPYAPNLPLVRPVLAAQ
ncbi:MAG: superoxide dismutase, Ni [Pseudomonadota bacterium]